MLKVHLLHLHEFKCINKVKNTHFFIQKKNKKVKVTFAYVLNTHPPITICIGKMTVFDVLRSLIIHLI